MKRIKKHDESLHVLSVDCWSVITSFFSRPNTIFNLRIVSNRINEDLNQPTVNYCESIDFKLVTNIQRRGHISVDYLDTLKHQYFVSSISIEPKNPEGTYIRESYDTEMKHRVFKGNAEVDDETIKKILKTFPRLRKIRIIDQFTGRHHSIQFNPSVLSMGRFIQHLHLISVTAGTVVNLSSLYEDLSKLTSLSSLILSNANIRITRIDSLSKLRKLKSLLLQDIRYGASILGSHERLERLVLQRTQPFKSFYPEEEVDFRFPNLKEFSIERIDIKDVQELHLLKKMLRYSNNLEKLEITHPWNIPDEKNEKCPQVNHFFDIFEESKTLRSLCIPYSNCFSCDAFNRIPPTLTKLDISYCTNVDPDSPHGFIFFLTRFVLLKDLNIDHCTQLDDRTLLSLSHNTLEKLSMIGCSQSTISSNGFKKFTNLKYLNITDCFQESFDDKFICDIFKRNSRLSRVRVYEKGIFSRRDVDKYLMTEKNGSNEQIQSIRVTILVPDSFDNFNYNFKKVMLWNIWWEKKLMNPLMAKCKNMKCQKCYGSKKEYTTLFTCESCNERRCTCCCIGKCVNEYN